VAGHFWKPYIGQTVGGELDFMVLAGGASLLFFNHMLISSWIAAHSSAPPISTIKSNSPPTACPREASKNAQPLHTHPEDGNCSVCRNVG
jgi:hypothetical protein